MFLHPLHLKVLSMQMVNGLLFRRDKAPHAVVELVPLGAAARSKEIQIGDILLAIGPLSVSDSSEICALRVRVYVRVCQ